LLQAGHTNAHPAKGSKKAAPPAPHPTEKLGAIGVTPYFTTGVSEFEDAETAVVKALAKAKKVRLIAMLVSDAGILKALAALKNKDIRGILDPHEMKQVMQPPKGKSKTDPALFWFARGDKRFVAAPSHAYSQQDNNDFMHNKAMILDDRVVITGSYNFSEHAEVNDENMLMIQSPAVAKAYNAYFDAVFAQYTKHGAPLPPQ
jgi:phosphatidylserine/phosphatidylglycerophosphate/cardiolipin synthase-like enzyme